MSIAFHPSMSLAARKNLAPLRWRKVTASLYEAADDTARLFGLAYMAEYRANYGLFTPAEILFAASLHGRRVEFV